MQAQLDFGEGPLRRLVRVDTMHPAAVVQHQFSGKPGAELTTVLLGNSIYERLATAPHGFPIQHTQLA